MRFTDPRVQAVLAALVIFRLLPNGFANHNLREHLAPLLGLAPTSLTQRQMSYDLRRLRLHGLIERIPRTHRYQVTDFGFHAAVVLCRAHDRLLRPALTTAATSSPSTPLGHALTAVDTAITAMLDLAA
jgi:DNA-binding transcriptional ArsR family regulator